MSYTCTGNASDIGTLATGLWLYALGQPTDLSALTLSGYFPQDYVVGALNAKISVCYSGSNGGSGVNWAICPDLDNGALNILGLQYLVNYWTQKVASAAGAGGVVGTWTSLSEGDSRIVRTSSAELMKVYKDMAKQAQAALDYAAAEYIQNEQGARWPRSVEMSSFYFGLNNGYNSNVPPYNV
jgi:hypothetical protein